MVYCIDSNIIIWGIKGQATTGQEEMIARAQALFTKFDSYQDEIIIPSIVLAEVLAPEPQTVRAKYLEILSKNFIISDFDSRAALKYAEIMHGRFQEIKEKSDESGISRQKMKADHMIIAIAIVNNANLIYSTDPGLRTFATGYIDVVDLPPVNPEPIPKGISTQTKLFEVTNEKGEENRNQDDTPF